MVYKKHCCYGVCNSDSRYPDRLEMQGVFFINFPKPKTQREKCEKWIHLCGRPKEQFSLERVGKMTFICSKHFVGGNGPTAENPDPLPATTRSEQVSKMMCPRKPPTPRSTCAPVIKRRKLLDDGVAIANTQDTAAPVDSNKNHDIPELTEVCLVCNKSKNHGTLKPFTDQTWGSFKRASESRLAMQTDRYRDLTLEINLQEEPGNAKYHSTCCRYFTAVKRKSSGPTNGESSAKVPETRKRTSLPSTDRKGLLKGSCIFCRVLRKMVNGKEEGLSDCLTKDGCDAIFENAQRSNNDRIKSLVLSGVDLIAKEAQYHKSCRRAYFKQCKEAAPKPDAVSSRQLHSEAFKTISDFINTEVIQNNKVMLVSSVQELYKAEYCSLGGREDDIAVYPIQALTRKLKDTFEDKILLSNYTKRQGNFLYSSSMSEIDARARFHGDEAKSKLQDMIRSTALHLRSLIHAIPKWKTPMPTSVHTLKTCSPELPEGLFLFYKTLMCGLREPTGDQNCQGIQRKVLSMSSDAVFNASKSTVRPWKQTALGLGIGTLTGSKLILSMLNRLGCCLSYGEVKALETEFAFTANEDDRDTPSGLRLDPNLGTGLAWDNYDVNMETLDGKDTLHATVGTCYQNKTEDDEMDDRPTAMRSGRNRRHFDGTERPIPAYHTPLRRAKFYITRSEQDEDLPYMRPIDLYWFLQSQIKPLPRFSGFYSQFVEDPLPQQKICYMDPISASPTRNDVVRETMMRSLNVAKETKQEYAVVTYDLAVALKAYSIQSLDAPLFDNLLILLGNFHLEMALYGAFGTYIKESGAEYILTESGILAEGSLMGFIRGKFYNRCTRIHEILGIVMERKLYEQFCKTLNQETRDEMMALLQNAPDDTTETQQYIDTTPAFDEYLKQYELYFNTVMGGALGPTAQYWAIYIFMVNRIHRELMRALRTNDINSYTAILPAVIDILFGLNRPNYARWGVLFLQKLATASPQSRMVLEKGAFSIRRTQKNYSRSAVDLTLEQTVNRDAASPMRGIVGFQNSENAVRRWCVTSTERGMAVTELRQLTGLTIEDVPATQLRPSRIRKDNEHINALMETLTESCDPFSAPASTTDNLLNLATGKATAPATKDYLLQTLEQGKIRRKKFQEDCKDDENRFMKSIQRRKVDNFASENSKKKRKSNTKAKPVTEGIRDTFVRMMVVVSESTNFNLKRVLEFPITDYPLSIAHGDGSILKTVKANLLNKLESMQNGFTQNELPRIDVTVIDGGLLLHSFLSVTSSIASYANLARNLLSHVCSNAGGEIHVLFDTYIQSSIKGYERQLRGAEDRTFVITGPEQAPKQSGQQLLKNGLFKDQLAIFLLGEWAKNHYGPIIGRKRLVVSHGGRCVTYTFNATENIMTVEHPPHLQGTHEEADTLIAFHVNHVKGHILVRASDTDVLVILLGMLGRKMGDNPDKIIMDCGSGNTRRYIDISSIATELEAKQPGLAAAQPGLHAFTGCDFTAAFYRKGKVKPFDILAEDVKGDFIDFFKRLTSVDEPDEEKAADFVCTLYGFKKLDNVDEARHAKLLQMTGKINKDNPLTNIKKIDCALLPPCTKTLQNKIRRAHYVSIMWGNAEASTPTDGLDPEKYGWKMENGCLVLDWFDGPVIPADLFHDKEDTDVDTGDQQAVDDAEYDDGSSTDSEWSDDSVESDSD